MHVNNSLQWSHRPELSIHAGLVTHYSERIASDIAKRGDNIISNQSDKLKNTEAI